MSDCLFCQLINKGQLALVYEDDLVVAFPDIDPKARVHLLIVPKRHIGSVNDIKPTDESLLGHLFTVAEQLADANKVAESGYRLIINTGDHAGQTVQHIHMHLLSGQALGEMNKQVLSTNSEQSLL